LGFSTDSEIGELETVMY